MLPVVDRKKSRTRWRFHQKAGYRRKKKSLHASEQERSRCGAEERALLQRAGFPLYNLSVSADALPPPLPRGGFGSPRKVNGFARGSTTRGAVERSETERLYEDRADGSRAVSTKKKTPFRSCSSGRGFFLFGVTILTLDIPDFSIPDSPQKSSAVQKVYSHSSLGIYCIFLSKFMVYLFCGLARPFYSGGR